MPTAETIGLHDSSTSQADVDSAHPVQEELTFPQILNGISALVSCMTPDGAIETVNGHVLEYFGKTLEELKRWTNTDAIHPEDRPGAIALWRRSVDNQEPYDMEVRQRGADGVYRWFHVQGLPVRSPEGRIIRWCVLQTDIDERKRAQEAVRESERELRHLIDNIPGFVCTLSPAGEIEVLNRRLLEYFGKTAKELRVWNTSDAVHPDDLPGVIDAWRQSIETGQPYLRELRQRRADGVYRWFQSRALPTRDTTGRVTGWYMLLTDIDDLKRAEDALRANEQSLRQIVDSIPGFVSTANAAGEIELINRQVLEYFDKTPEELKNWGASGVLHPDDLPRMIDGWRRALETGQTLDLEYRSRGTDGVYRWFHQRNRPQRDAEGRIVRWYILGTDIDDRKTAEEALRRTQTRLSRATQVATVGELAASIAHEVNQPLASVVTNAHAAETWLSHDPPNLDRARATLDRIIRDGHSAAEVLRRIRALFKEAALVKVPLDVNQIVAEVLGVLAEELRDKSITVETDLEVGLPMIDADRVQIQQTLINLVHNAAEAMCGVTDRAKTLALSSRQEGKAVLIQVRDHGAGSKDTTLIFEPFFTTKESGMGMGLSICRSIIEAHGGQVWAKANEDAGMTFSFTLPMLSGPQ